ncbi:MAG: hypothetical protein A3C07_00265 [Candidatus Sungbacteria bacterium RIFCSPHIGHO2_02_FULL_47_11]|uniref:Uncharacterized protein n=1 Tax=Candidatus Sungbacteria bacterium RIFCSPHIGHO2_02_FULL_47_11 TaxID=1802270 RepID=A0A1G2KL31_9BACT|nr:MAG: hypothetical protein A3C07_00265 [Candidatus Sungbacteria bacterium RIFCSPHIGHO2_02_FULL_47_11]
MATSRERFKNNEKIDELQRRLDIEFEEYKKVHLAEMRKEYEKLVKMDIMRTEKLESKLKKKQWEFSEMDLFQRNVAVLNNFHLWFPGGLYRSVQEEIKRRGNVNKDEIEADERLINDLDEIIKKQGYEAVAENIVKQEGAGKEARLKMLADIYIRMRDKGYDRLRLVQ